MTDIVERLRRRGKAAPPFSYANDDDLLAAADEIERLRAELAHWRNAEADARALRAGADAACEFVAAERDRLRAELATAQKDAERCEFIRKNIWRAWDVLSNAVDVNAPGALWRRQFDSAIDAALKEKP